MSSATLPSEHQWVQKEFAAELLHEAVINKRLQEGD
jgi:hypothetical protein